MQNAMNRGKKCVLRNFTERTEKRPTSPVHASNRHLCVQK